MAAWWQEQVAYQIYPRSFMDSNGDGIGDIPGIISRLPILKNLGIGILWLSPVYASPNDDNGYDISDYRQIHPDYGTMADMEELIHQAESLGIRLVMDLVINHTSDEHVWFQNSRDPKSPYRDYYYWRPGKGGQAAKPGDKKDLPNNWTSFFAEDCWEYDEKSQEYYLHLFSKKQPDLNYHNPQVLKEVKSIMTFWLDKGVAGFRCDVINLLYKTSLEKGRRRFILTGSEHYLTTPGLHQLLQEFRRDIWDKYDCFTVGETVFVTPQQGQDLSDPERKELDTIFSFEHMETDQIIVKWFKRPFSPARFAQVISKWQKTLFWPANYLENHDQIRSLSRFGDPQKYPLPSGKMLATLLLSLRGTPFIYQGQELGMTNFDFSSMAEIRDIESINVNRLAKKLKIPAALRWKMIQATSRDNTRTPMQWDSSPHGGFTKGTPWISVNQNYHTINWEKEKADPESLWHFYQRLIALRQQSEVLKFGDFTPLYIGSKLFIFSRSLADEQVIIILSFSSRAQKVKLPLTGNVLINNYEHKNFNPILKPYEAMILQNTEKTGGKP